MPIHRVPRSTVDQDLRDIRHDCEHVVSIQPDADPAFLLIYTEFDTTEIETRPAS